MDVDTLNSKAIKKISDTDGALLSERLAKCDVRSLILLTNSLTHSLTQATTFGYIVEIFNNAVSILFRASTPPSPSQIILLDTLALLSSINNVCGTMVHCVVF